MDKFVLMNELIIKPGQYYLLILIAHQIWVKKKSTFELHLNQKLSIKIS